MSGIETSTNSVDKTNAFDNEIISIDFRLNKQNYDYYRRTYIKFQSFLADMMSLINALFSVCRLISEFLLSKKMNKDIIRYIMTQDKIKKTNISKEKVYNNTYINNYKIKKENTGKRITNVKSVENSKRSYI